jgi:signal transduction histidine kinase
VAARGAATLRDLDARRHEALAALAGSGATGAQVAAVAALGAEAGDDAAAPAARLDPLAESDREQDVLDALGSRGVEVGHEVAAAFAEAGLGPEWIDRVAAAAGDDGLAAGLRHLAACAATRVVLAEVQEATTRIADLVAAVRDYSYLDQGPRQTVDIHEGLESTLALLAHKLREKQAVVVRDLDDALPTVEASGSELNQVWTNLIDNAADAIAPGGRITLRTRAQGVRVSVEIADDGPGVPADLQARIFDAFFTTKPVGRGTGLGLDIAQRIVVRHHGELRLESAPGDTRFQVVLPAG